MSDFRCIYCRRFHIECRCTWWERNGADVWMGTLTLLSIILIIVLLGKK